MDEKDGTQYLGGYQLRLAILLLVFAFVFYSVF